MKQFQGSLDIHTDGNGLIDITSRIEGWLREQPISTGLLTVFIRHTSASLTISENADPDVLTDLESFFKRTVPENPDHYSHTAEGRDDMPAHIRCALTDVQLSIPVTGANLALGTWQGIYLYEHRARPHRRRVVLHLIGE